MKSTTPDLIPDAGELPGVPKGEGFFWCGHCRHVVELSQRQVDAAENAPAGSLAKLKCPRCHHYEARWRVPSPERERPEPPSVPAHSDQAQALFAQLKGVLA